MEGTVSLIPALVLALAYILQPLVSTNLDTPWRKFWTFSREPSGETSPPNGSSSPDRRPMTDGGRVCHNCGSHVEGDYLYCAECLMPRV
ncbi:hypothetical protein [Salinibaculum rarum]|jgi:hypothetical protein|uniref:hypothetical protein n=1 Tax=Salinibaculum rarum TaxID=3058903 RepID=UPI00265F52C2|nr:hypothetical protein [Salinibaculum sp. KK48]